jgi:hypothetical protein
MIIILGLLILVAAVVVGVAGVLTNHGSGHVLTHRFAVFGYHVNGSTGRLFLYGIVVGAVAVFGLSLLLTGARRTSRRGRAARQGLTQSRGETAAVRADRDDLIDQREAARAETTSVARNGSPDANSHLENEPPRRSLVHPLGHHAAPPEAPTASPEIADQSARS